MSKRTKGILFIVLSALLFAAMNLFVKLSGELPTFQKVFFRNAVASVFAFIILIKNKERFLPRSKQSAVFLSLRTVCGLLGVICNFYALDRLVLSDASILNKMSPFFAIIFSMAILKERPKLLQWLPVAGAFVGTLFVVKPSFSNTALIPALIGLLGGAAAGLAYTFVRKLSKMGESRAYIVFFFSFVSTLAILPKFLIDYVPMSLYQWGCLISAGVCAAFAQFAITTAYACAPAKEISVYDYSQIVFAAAFGLIFFGSLPDVFSVIGYVIIAAMAVWNYFLSNKKGALKPSKPE